MPPDHREHPSAYVCRLYNDRLARSGSPLRWVTTAGGGMGLRRLDESRGPSVSNTEKDTPHE